MKFSATLKTLPPLAAALGLITAGCNRDNVRVYNVDTNDVTAASTPAPALGAAPETSPQAAPDMANMPATMPPGLPVPDNSGLPALKYTLPAGWQEKPLTQMRVASFSVSGNGKQADVSVIPLGGMAGGDLANVNRWRGQVGQAPLGDDDLSKLAEKVQVGSDPADLYDIAGTSDTGPERILGTIFHRDNTVWFFKMTGDPTLVENQKTAFVRLLQSIQFDDSTAPPAMNAAQLPPAHPAIDAGTVPSQAPAPAMGNIPAWTVPSGWQPGPLEQFLIAKFVITSPGNAQADVNVSVLSDDGGGVAANVDRWRQQLGLDPLPADSVAQLPTVDVAGAKATVMDFSGIDAMSGQPARSVGIILPLGGQTWFYKLMGNPAVVAAQKEALIKFVQTAKYPGTP